MPFEENCSTATTIAKNIKAVQQRIVQGAELAQREPKEVQLLAVCKTNPVAMIRDAYQTGHRHFGENYVQESVEKIKEIQADTDFSDPIIWHFIGLLQSNKTALVAANFDWVQSVDRTKIARRLSEQRPSNLPPINICVQVNISEESAKSGVSSDQALALAAFVNEQPNLTLRGIMGIPEKTDDTEKLKLQFTELFDIFYHLKHQYEAVDTLSMGMSGDLAAAINCGSTMVRIGTDIFGSRDY